MKFGKVDHPELVDFTLPPDDPMTEALLKKTTTEEPFRLYVGCAKWNRQDLKNFYPRGTKDELTYYSSQFNCIELNATFYRIFPAEQYRKWYDRTPAHFKFFPKITNEISHLRRLNERIYDTVDRYLEVTSLLKEKLGTIFLQMHNNFSPKDFDRVVRFVEYWPKEFALAMEFRHTDWFNDKQVSQELYHLLEENNIANILVDTAGRRDLLHMRLTNNEAFVGEPLRSWQLSAHPHVLSVSPLCLSASPLGINTVSQSLSLSRRPSLSQSFQSSSGSCHIPEKGSGQLSDGPETWV